MRGMTNSETRLDRIEKKLDKLMSNDLLHIHQKVAELGARQTLLITLITGVLIGVTISLFK
jgi:tetrahydromethanopterin S-methyltransferase subunit G